MAVRLWGEPGCYITKRLLAVFLCESLEATIFSDLCARWLPHPPTPQLKDDIINIFLKCPKSNRVN